MYCLDSANKLLIMRSTSNMQCKDTEALWMTGPKTNTFYALIRPTGAKPRRYVGFVQSI